MNVRDIRALVTDPNRGPWYHIRAAADAEESAEVYIYDEIDSWFGVSAEQFARDLAAIDAPTLSVHINSPGGNAYDGVAIMNAIAGHPAETTAFIDGLAASAASYIALGADAVVMRPGAQMMIHNAWGVSVGDARDMTAMADQLNRMDGVIADLYVQKTGATLDEIRELMAAETWFTADEAVEVGLADRVEAPAKGKKSDAKARVFDLSVFNYAGRRAAPAPRLPKTTSARFRAEDNPGERRATMPTLIEGLRATLGLPEDADEAAVLAAVAARADSAGAATTDAGKPPTLQQIAASAKELGLRLVDAEQYDQLAAQAAQGAQAFAKMQKQHRDKVLADALRDGRIAKAQRDTYAAQMERDAKNGSDDTEKFLMSLPKNTVVPVEEIGHAGEPDSVDVEAAAYADVFAQITGVSYDDKKA